MYLLSVIMRLIFLLIVLMTTCNACKKAFKNDHGLKRHRISCKPAKQITAGLFQKRQELQKDLRRGRNFSDVPQAAHETQMVSIEIIIPD